MDAGLKTHRFDRLTFWGRCWFFRVVDRNNGKTVAQSEAYNSRAARDHTADRLDRAFGHKTGDAK